ncbi:MAG: formyltransferase family protein [Bacteroidia bacterium]|nr:phosphoribosylglycinamide formyltransferase [Bacteroidia bacterium]MDW8157290.1 formyltransferase family protein [Bacteroidia bacterium]
MNFAIFASGQGTVAQAIWEYFSNHWLVPSLVVSNNPRALVIERANRANLAVYIHNQSVSFLYNCLQGHGVRLIILAGYLKLIPPFIIQSYPNAVLNIHPSLLPKYGGKGMYGIRVHQAVLDAQEEQTGFTIHLVNEKYDEGPVLMQQVVDVPSNCTAQELMQKIQELEKYYYPRFIENYASSLIKDLSC